MATWGRDFEWGGVGVWGLGVLVHRTRFSLVAVWLMLGPLEAWLDVQLPIPCRFDDYEEEFGDD